MKDTSPVGVPAPGGTGVTWAVKVTVSPQTEGSGSKASVVVVFARVTSWVSAPVDGSYSTSPE